MALDTNILVYAEGLNGEDRKQRAHAALTSFARVQCSGRVVSVLEGGYHLEALAASALAHVEELARA